MRFAIRHVTNYKFSRAAFLEPHSIRLHPRIDGSQRLESFEIELSPRPQGTCTLLDAEGNVATSAWFDSVSDHLCITTNATIDTMRTNPFDYLLSEANAELPVRYGRALQPLLASARQRAAIPNRSDPVRELAAELLRSSERKLPKFLMSLCNKIYDTWRPIHRDSGDPWPPEQTYERQSGSCRDLAWLYIDACRSVGVAARFVSGYQQGDEDQHQRELHAWAEVYIPGGGWRGFDPTHGLGVSNAHVALAASVTPAGVAPVVGSYRGSGVTSEIEYDIRMKVIDTPVTSSA